MTPKESKTDRFNQIKQRILDQREKRNDDKDNQFTQPVDKPTPAPVNPFGKSRDNVINFPTPLPVSLSDKNLLPSPLIVAPIGAAQETTARNIVDSLDIVNDSLVEGLVDIATDTNQIRMIKALEDGFSNFNRGNGGISNVMDNSALAKFDDVGTQAKQLGVFGKVGKAFNDVRNLTATFVPFIGKVNDGIKSVGTRLLTFSQKQTEYLQSNNKYLKGVEETMRSVDESLLKMLYKDRDGNDIRSSVADGSKKLSIRDNMLSKFDDKWSKIFGGTKLDDDTNGLKTTMRGITGITGFFANMGAIIAGFLLSPALKFLSVGATALPGTMSTNLGAIFGFLGGLTGVLTAIGGVVAVAMTWSIIKDPSYIGRYMEAFGELFERSIGPTLKWLGTEIVPQVLLVFAGLVYVGEMLLTSLGNFMNDAAILTIGKVLPELFESIGEAFFTISDSTFQFAAGLVDVALRIAGMFGVGQYAGEGFLGNVTGIFQTFISTMLTVWDTVITGLVKIFNLDKLLGIGAGEGEGWTMLGLLTKFFTTSLPEIINNTMTSLTSYIASINPIPTIQSKIGAFVNGIIDLIPTWEDIKTWLRAIIPNEQIQQWFGLAPGGIDSVGNGVSINEMNDFTGGKLLSVVGKQLESVTGLAQEPSNIGGPNQNLYQQYLAEEAAKRARQSQSNVVIAPVNNVTTNNNSNVTHGRGGARGPVTTRPQQTPWHENLFEIKAY